MRQASAILLPQGCTETLWNAARQCCSRIFPDYRCRFLYKGKLGDIRLFQNYRLPHPRSWLFPTVDSCPPQFWDNATYPLVVKHNEGGEGSHVFLLNNRESVAPILRMFAGMEKNGFSGFLAQERIPTNGRDLRVVIMGDTIYSYWRVQGAEESFYHNLSKGAVLDMVSDPHLQAVGRHWARHLSCVSGINLAGLDFLFPVNEGHVTGHPLFLEINYYFGRKGLGGSKNFYRLLEEASQAWLKRVGCVGP